MLIVTISVALSETLKADHGFNVESRAIHDLIEIMAAYDAPMRRSYLQFITGSPKLPIGGPYSFSLCVVFVAGLIIHRRFQRPQPAVDRRP